MPNQTKANKRKLDISEEEFKKARSEIKKILDGDQTPEPDVPDDKKIPVDRIEDNSVQETEAQPVHKVDSQAARNFSSLYQNGRGEKVDMTKIDKKDPNRKKRIIGWIVFILVILMAVTLAGFYFFVNYQGKFSENVALTAVIPKTVASGDELSFTISVENNEEVDLLETELTMQFPAGIVFVSSTPQTVNEANNAWHLGEIKGGSTKQVKITCLVRGEIGSSKTLEVILSYMPANFRSEFQKQKSIPININESVFDLKVRTPIKVISGAAAEYKVSFTNNSSEDIGQARLVLTLPDDLEVENFNPEPNGEEHIWEIGQLNSLESYEVSWQGAMSASEGAMREIKAEAGYVDENGRFQVQVEEISIIFVINPQLILTLLIGDSSSDNTASFGQSLDYTISYQNESQSEIKNMNLSVELSGETVDWASLVDTNNGQITDNIMNWGSEQIPDLELVKPGDEGELKFSINVKDNILAQSEEDINYSITSQAKAVSSEVADLEGGKLEVESASITTKLNSRLDLRAQGRYYNEEYMVVGDGPLPPEVGQTTTYQIYWYLQNNANEVKDVEVAARLPLGAVWADDSITSAGDLSYDSTLRTVTWSINKIPPHVGQLIPELEVRFALAVTPTVDDLGKLLILLQKSTVMGEDTFTGELIEKTQDIITSDLKNDPQAMDKGLVVSKVD